MTQIRKWEHQCDDRLFSAQILTPLMAQIWKISSVFYGRGAADKRRQLGACRDTAMLSDTDNVEAHMYF